MPWGCTHPHTECSSLCVRLVTSIFPCVHTFASACICVHLRASACVCVCPYAFACVCLHSSVFICIQNIKRLDTFRRKWISASGCIFCSRTFSMYYNSLDNSYTFRAVFFFRSVFCCNSACLYVQAGLSNRSVCLWLSVCISHWFCQRLQQIRSSWELYFHSE